MMFKIWCEYDIGQDSCVFTTEEKALEWAAIQLSYQDVSYQDALDDELLFTEAVKVY